MLVSVWRRLKIDYLMSVWFLGFCPARPLSAEWKKFNQAHEDATQRRPERRDQDRM